MNVNTTEEMWTTWVDFVNILVVILYFILQVVISGEMDKGYVGSFCIMFL